MGLTLQERKSVTREMQRKYFRASRAEKSRMLDQFTQLNRQNNLVERSAVGYLRYEGAGEVALLIRHYTLLRLQINFLFPSMKLKEKTRIGSRVYRHQDIPKTLYQRVLDSAQLTKGKKGRLAPAAPDD